MDVNQGEQKNNYKTKFLNLCIPGELGLENYWELLKF